MYFVISEQQLQQKITNLLRHHGVPLATAQLLACRISDAERDGTRSHGLARLPDYLASLNAGWINARATAVVKAEDSPFISIDGDNGFTQHALWQALPEINARTERYGIAFAGVRNAHHIGALWTDNEYFALQGKVVLNFVNSRPRLALYGSSQPLTGTNAMAFSFPDGAGRVLGWDQASSALSLGEVKQYALRGEPLPPGAGLDKKGLPVTDPFAVLDGGTLLPFGGHKGAGIALMVEIMAAALTGANFGFNDRSGGYPGAASSNAGQTLIVINPAFSSPVPFASRIAALVDHFHSDPAVRLPGERRREQRLITQQRGFGISEEIARLLNI